MASLNKVMVIGNLGKDPEIRATPSGSKVATFSIAVTERFKDKNGQQKETTEWVNLVLWRKQAEIAEKYLRKGSAIYAEGKLQTQSWDDPQGNKRFKVEVVVSNFQMLGSKGNSSENPNSSSQSFGGQETPPPYEDSIPF